MLRGLLNTPANRALLAAMDGLSLRQQTIATNLANVDTPGYRAAEVTFESHLQQAMGTPNRLALVCTHPGHLSGSRLPSAGNKAQVRAVSDSPARNDGNNVDVDREMARLAETQIAYQTLTQLATNRIAGLRSIIMEGRR